MILLRPVILACVAFSAASASAQHEYSPVGSLTPRSVRYGAGREQRIAVYPAESAKPAPVILYFEGGDWPGVPHTERIDLLLKALQDRGYTVVRVRYESELKDAFTTELRAQISALWADPKLRLDLSRVALWGWGTGGLYAALLGTELERMDAIGLARDAIKCVVLFNGEGFDLPNAISASSQRRRARLQALFPDTVAATLSPITHVAQPNAKSFLLLSDPAHAWSRKDGSVFADRLARSGTDVRVRSMPTQDNSTPDLYLGAPSNAATRTILDFLAEHLAGT